MSTFLFFINHHLVISLPEPIYVPVKQVRGYAMEMTIPMSIFKIVKDPDQLAQDIQAAAMNTFKSLVDAD